MTTTAELWKRYKQYLCNMDAVAMSVDVSRIRFADNFLEEMAAPMRRAFAEMSALEAGEIANADESRMVGHYWLRAPHLAPNDDIRQTITATLANIKQFAADVHSGAVATPDGDRFTHVIVVGIGGSALGPQLLAGALSDSTDPMQVFFCDNTDPDGIDRTLATIGHALKNTITLVISKSGGTTETRNAMLEVQRACDQASIPFAPCAVAITQEGSALDQRAANEKWLRRFPMWDWIGGRTSVLSAVGLVPAALQGIDIDAMLAGAADCDEQTRRDEVLTNPAALLALMWHYAGAGCGDKQMVVLPYKDRLLLLGRYLQQLVMESLGKREDRDGKEVCQGLTVYGNKGSTDQHAYVQQLRDGRDDFFALFVEVLRDRAGESIEVEEDVTTGDYLQGFLMGTRHALWESGRDSITVTIDRVSARSLGALIALFERAVGLYASLINVNAYHQPGVEAGKKAASEIIDVQRKLLIAMRAEEGTQKTADQWAESTQLAGRIEDVHKILQHLAANDRINTTPSAAPIETQYGS